MVRPDFDGMDRLLFVNENHRDDMRVVMIGATCNAIARMCVGLQVGVVRVCNAMHVCAGVCGCVHRFVCLWTWIAACVCWASWQWHAAAPRITDWGSEYGLPRIVRARRIEGLRISLGVVSIHKCSA